MKILILTAVNKRRYLRTIGGMTRSAWNIYRALIKHKIYAYLINIYIFNSEVGYAEIINENNKKIKSIAQFQPNLQGYIKYIEETSNFIRKCKFDIIFLQLNINQAVDIMKTTKLPFIVSVPNPTQHVYLKEEINFNNNDRNIIKQRWLITNAEAVRCLTRSNANEILRYYPKIRYFIIPEGIYNETQDTETNINIKKLRKMIAPRSEKIIYHISHWTKGKGMDFFIEAIPKILKKYPKVKFVIAGDSSDNSQAGYKSSMRETIKKLNLEDKVIFPGLLLDNEKNAYFKIADIFILPALHESLPHVLLEAVIHKVPIVTTNVDGLQDMLEDGVTALQSPPPNTSAGLNLITKNILKLLSDEKLCESLKENAYNKVMEDYHWDKLLPKLLYHFKLIIKRRKTHTTCLQKSA